MVAPQLQPVQGLHHPDADLSCNVKKSKSPQVPPLPGGGSQLRGCIDITLPSVNMSDCPSAASSPRAGGR